MDSTIPANPNNNFINLLGVALAAGALVWCAASGIRGVEAALLSAGAYAIPVLLLEVIFLRTPRRKSVGLAWDQGVRLWPFLLSAALCAYAVWLYQEALISKAYYTGGFGIKLAIAAALYILSIGDLFLRCGSDWRRTGFRLAGMYGSIGFVAVLYWLFPEYHGSFYNPFWHALFILGPYALALAVPYAIFMDASLSEPEDSYYRFGRLLLGCWKGVEKRVILQHLLGWVVKGFFLPLMWVSFNGDVNLLMRPHLFGEFDSLDALYWHFGTFFQRSLDVLFTVDLLAAVSGYALAIRLFDTHIRSTEPTTFGWLVCLMCYQPFQSVYMNFYLVYGPNNWIDWLSDFPNFRIVWGCVSLTLLLIYTTASINFGCRFSNLTHRGILTKGAYRFTKHPAYVCKNIHWWMVFVPFAPVHGWASALRFTLLVSGISTVYYLRARTEERHLSRDPNYVAYALWMNEHGVLRGLARLFPWMRYRPPVPAPSAELVLDGAKRH